MLKAKDIMVKDIIDVKKTTPIYDAIELLKKNNITDLPVTEYDGTLIGILSEKDVIGLLFYASGDEENKTVADFMTQPPIYFDEEESLLKVCDSLTIHPFRRVPITSQGRLIGLISRADILDCILYLRSENKNVPAEQPK